VYLSDIVWSWLLHRDHVCSAGQWLFVLEMTRKFISHHPVHVSPIKETGPGIFQQQYNLYSRLFIRSNCFNSPVISLIINYLILCRVQALDELHPALEHKIYIVISVNDDMTRRRRYYDNAICEMLYAHA
jgi:hypothetical protein